MKQTAHPRNTDWTIELWRGCAAWLVVYVHYWAFTGHDAAWLRFSFTGVDLFFVLSGAVFAPYLFGQPLGLRGFALRRFFRIYPAYALALLLYGWQKWQAGGALIYVWQHLSFSHVQSREMAFYYNPPFWSLPAEVEFYICLPLLAYLTRRWRFAGPLLLLGALALRVTLGWFSVPTTQNSAYIYLYHLPGMGIEFGLGALAWRLGRQALTRAQRLGLFGLGLIAWLVLAWHFGQVGDAGIDQSLARGQMSWLAALCFALMVGATLAAPKEAGPTKASCWRTCALWVGRLSYGVYLFHIAALKLLEPYQAALNKLPMLGLQGAALLLTLGLAWLVYVGWENPWRQAGRRWAAALKQTASHPA